MNAPSETRRIHELYSPSAKTISAVDVPPMNFLMVDGEGDPNTSRSYREAIEALYGLSYTLKFMVKREHPDRDFRVMPLEGLWWAAENGPLDLARKDRWQWTAMIMQPDVVTADLVARATAELRAKRNPAALDRARFESFHEGPAAQILYVGPYAGEMPTIERLHACITEQGQRLRGRHHEIYLGDPRRAAPEKLRTVIRQPFA